MNPKVLVLTAPSGSGKTTIAQRVLAAFPNMQFSVSATTRLPRPHEQDGVHYHFVTPEQFQQYIAEDALFEYQEVYTGRLYGTLRAEVECAARTAPVLLDIDVKGAMNVKAAYGNRALVLFIRPPSLAVLAERLKARATEDAASLKKRLERTAEEMTYAERCDAVIVNDDLETAVAETLAWVRAFVK